LTVFVGRLQTSFAALFLVDVVFLTAETDTAASVIWWFSSDSGFSGPLGGVPSKDLWLGGVHGSLGGGFEGGVRVDGGGGGGCIVVVVELFSILALEDFFKGRGPVNRGRGEHAPDSEPFGHPDVVDFVDEVVSETVFTELDKVVDVEPAPVVWVRSGTDFDLFWLEDTLHEFSDHLGVFVFVDRVHTDPEVDDVTFPFHWLDVVFLGVGGGQVGQVTWQVLMEPEDIAVHTPWHGRFKWTQSPVGSGGEHLVGLFKAGLSSGVGNFTHGGFEPLPWKFGRSFDWGFLQSFWLDILPDEPESQVGSAFRWALFLFKTDDVLV